MGGAETLVKEYCLKLDKEKYDVQVLCFYKYHTPIEECLTDAGIKITYLEDISAYKKEGGNAKLRRIWFFIKRIVMVRMYIKKEKPDVIHSHLNSNTYVWLAGPKRAAKIFHMVHSEPAALWDDSFESKLDFYAAKSLVKTHKMRFIALHEKMKEETNTLFDVKDTIVLNNGIDFERFDNALSKKTVRKNEGIPENAVVIGHVGRFNKTKNHTFLVDVFYEIYKKNKNAYLLMVGNGELMPEIIEKLHGYGLEDCYKILSFRMDVPNLLNAMDYFVFPSLFEGLSIVMIEAQKMKLPCFVANTISEETQISNLVHWNSLEESPKVWAERILNYKKEELCYTKLEMWDMRNIVKYLESIYEK